MNNNSDIYRGARTDLALELNSEVDKSDTRLKGVKVSKIKDGFSDVRITRLDILSEAGASLIGKDIGSYVTIEAPGLGRCDEDYSSHVAYIVSRELDDMLSDYIADNKHILVIGLGNREITADSLGPRVIDGLVVNRHIFGYDSQIVKVSGLVPGVMSQTGMETSEIIKGVVKVTNPGAVIVVDALAARDKERLNKTVQVSNAGIRPGSGVGNHRQGITKETIGRPVVAVGVPTVVELCNMLVTPKDVDICVGNIATVVAEAINNVVYEL